MKFYTIICICILLTINYVHADGIESTVFRCNENDRVQLVKETSNVTAPLYEMNDIIRGLTKYYWQYLHKNQDVDFSLAQDARKREFAKSYENCYLKIKKPTTFLSINLALYKLGVGKIINGYSSEFIEARNIVNTECKKTGDKDICKTATIMSDIDNPNSEIIKSIPTR